MGHGRRSADTVALLVSDPEERPAALAAIDRLEVEAAAATTALPGALEFLESLPRGRWAPTPSGTRGTADAEPHSTPAVAATPACRRGACPEAWGRHACLPGRRSPHGCRQPTMTTGLTTVWSRLRISSRLCPTASQPCST